MLRKGFLLQKNKGEAEVDVDTCKHCKVAFTRLTTHLNQKLECKAAYTEDENSEGGEMRLKLRIRLPIFKNEGLIKT